MKIYGLPVQHYVGRHMNCPAMFCAEAAEICNELEYKIRMAEAEMDQWDDEYDLERDDSFLLEYPFKPTRFERIVAFFTEWFYNCSEGQFKALLAMCVISAFIAMGWAFLLHATAAY